MNILYKFPKRKYWIPYTFLIVLMVSVLTFMIFGSIDFSKLKDKINKQTETTAPVIPPAEEQTPQEQAFYELFAKVEILESLSTSVDQTVSYLRSVVYNSSAWNMLFGEVDSNFIASVESYDTEHGTDISSLRSSDSRYFVIPATNETVDLFHMFAAMEGYLTGTSQMTDLAGWGGDLLQLAGDNNPNGFNVEGSSFGPADVCADFDAVNIVAKYNSSSNKSLYYHIVEYYKNLTNKSRIQQFKNNIFPSTPTSIDDITSFESTIFSRLKTSSTTGYVAYGFSSIFGYQFISKETTIKECIHKMAYYMLTEINA